MVKQHGSASEGRQARPGGGRSAAKAGARGGTPGDGGHRRSSKVRVSPQRGTRRAPTGNGPEIAGAPGMGADGGGSDRRGGQRPTGEADRRGGPRLAPTRARQPEPAIANGVTGHELDRSVRAQLRTLSKENAEGVAQHLVMAAALLDEDPLAALAHAETAVRRAGRVPAAREALGLVAYRQGDFARALGEFRTARRLSGSAHLLPLIVDCERALGRPARALEIAASPQARNLGAQDRVELAIVVSGIRRDAGQLEAAAAGLEIPELRSPARRPWTARLCYAYAEAQLALGSRDAARHWFARAVEADPDLTTDAAERLEELDGVAYTDLLGDDGADERDGLGKPEE